MRSGKGTIRNFIRNLDEDSKERSNELYDEHIVALTKVHSIFRWKQRNFNVLQRKSKSKPGDMDPACGQQGLCCLRRLSHFQMGASFVSDSLHNLYAGVFVRIDDHMEILIEDFC